MKPGPEYKKNREELCDLTEGVVRNVRASATTTPARIEAANDLENLISAFRRGGFEEAAALCASRAASPEKHN